MKYLFYIIIVVLFLSGSKNLVASNYWEKSDIEQDTYTKIGTSPNGYLWLGSWHSGLYVSRDEGITWELEEGEEFLGASVEDINFDFDGSIYVSITYFGPGSPGLYKSNDNGANWTKVFNKSVEATAFTKNGTIIIATQSDGIYYGNINNSDWNKLNSSVNFQYPTAIGINSTGKIFIASENKLYMSDESLNNWETIGGNILSDTYIYDIVFDKDDNIYIGTLGKGIYKSTDNGQTWVQQNAAKDKNIKDMFIAPTGNIFAGTDGDYTYVSNDNGNTWIQENSGVPELAKTANGFSYLNGRIFMATNGGVFRTTSLLSVNDINPVDGINIYPNPAQSRIRINLESLPLASSVDINIFDSKGNTVKKVNDAYYIGTYSISVEDLSSGTYFIRIAVGKVIYTGQLTVIK